MSLWYLGIFTARLGFRYSNYEKFFWDKPRSKREFTVQSCGRGEWEKFRRYHYLNSELNKTSRCYGVFDGNSIIAFMAIIHNPNPTNPKIKRVHRLVVLPDYQGVGIGRNFLNIIARKYRAEGYDFSITTSANNLLCALTKDERWDCIRYSKVKQSESGLKSFKRTMRSSVKTATFFFR